MNKDPDFVDGWVEKIEAAQRQPTETIGGKTYQRVRYGADYPDGKPRCHDCGVEHGQLHVPNCSIERCPRCLGQAIGCPCADAVAH